MKKTVQIIYTTFFSFLSYSTNELLIEKLHVEHGRYVTEPGSNKLYSGIAVRKFDSGQISYEVNFRNGIPKGTWTSFGYDGEIIQSGKFVPHSFMHQSIKSIGRIIRVNVCMVKEGSENFIEVYVVTDDFKELDLKKHSTLFKRILNDIRSSNIEINYDLVEVAHIVKAELKTYRQ